MKRQASICALPLERTPKASKRQDTLKPITGDADHQIPEPTGSVVDTARSDIAGTISTNDLKVLNDASPAQITQNPSLALDKVSQDVNATVLHMLSNLDPTPSAHFKPFSDEYFDNTQPKIREWRGRVDFSARRSNLIFEALDPSVPNAVQRCDKSSRKIFCSMPRAGFTGENIHDQANKVLGQLVLMLNKYTGPADAIVMLKPGTELGNLLGRVAMSRVVGKNYKRTVPSPLIFTGHAFKVLFEVDFFNAETGKMDKILRQRRMTCNTPLFEVPPVRNVHFTRRGALVDIRDGSSVSLVPKDPAKLNGVAVEVWRGVESLYRMMAASLDGARVSKADAITFMDKLEEMYKVEA